MARAPLAVLLAAAVFLPGWIAAAGPADALCILDNCADERPAPGHPFRRNGSGPRGASRPGEFDFYVLALSWSPGFCATGGDDKGRDQCRSGAGLGFTVHGLWPQYADGYPSDCDGPRAPPRAALAATDGVYPDEGLARYEWRKHGTCSGLSPAAYFAAARQARDAVTVPPGFKNPHQDQSLAPADVVRAFTDANPRLRPGMLAAVCRSGTLDEVRICLTRDLRAFYYCPEVVREGCRGGSVDVPPVR